MKKALMLFLMSFFPAPAFADGIDLNWVMVVKVKFLFLLLPIVILGWLLLKRKIKQIPSRKIFSWVLTVNIIIYFISLLVSCVFILYLTILRLRNELLFGLSELSDKTFGIFTDFIHFCIYFGPEMCVMFVLSWWVEYKYIVRKIRKTVAPTEDISGLRKIVKKTVLLVNSIAYGLCLGFFLIILIAKPPKEEECIYFETDTFSIITCFVNNQEEWKWEPEELN